MSKKNKTYWDGYKQYTLKDGTKFYIQDDHDGDIIS